MPRRWNGLFGASGLRAVALSINSPGGSPVQSSLLFRRIRQLAAEKGVPVFAFAEDVAASGGYWLALAGDEVWAEESSLLGSIGVVTASFGVHRLIERFGIERRLYTAGERKSLLDPFLAGGPVRCRAALGAAAGHSRQLQGARTSAPRRQDRPGRR